MRKRFSRGIILLLVLFSFGFLQTGADIEKNDSQPTPYYVDFTNNLAPAIDASVTIYVEEYGKAGRKTGAGVLWRGEEDVCYVLTCAHLFEEMTDPEITVFSFRNALPYGGESATLIGKSKDYDIAVLKAKWPKGTTQVRKASQEEIMGMPVFALGNPEGQGGSVSGGVLSVPYEEVGDQFFHRIDCTLLPGNSGGGLFDNNGNIIGLVTSKIITENPLDGYGYAIPFSVAETVANAILDAQDNGKNTLPSFDFSYRVIDVQKNTNGTWEEQIAIEETAQNDSLSVGDRIKAVSINGQTHDITSKSQLSLLLLSATPNTVINMTIWHYDEEKNIQIQVGEIVFE